MRITIATIALTALMSILAPLCARADFVLVPPPVISDGIRGPTGGAARNPLLPQVRYTIARGFGEQVPLSFAVRQIVPALIKVHFGTGVDRATPVDWQGGRPWNAVLWSAIHPLGLHLSLKPGAAWISN